MSMNVNVMNLLTQLKKPSLLFHLAEPTPTLQTPNLDSHSGGHPYQQQDEAHPHCTCGEPMTFLFQIRTYEQGMISLHVIYACMPCHWNRQAGEAFQIRSYPSPSLDEAKSFEDPPSLTPAEVFMEPTWSLPDWFSLAIHHPTLHTRLGTLYKDQARTQYERLTDEAIGQEHPDDSFSHYGGYPAFLDEPDFSLNCPCCEKPYHFWMQVDSSENHGVIFRDYLTLYLFRCPTTNAIHPYLH